MLETKPRYGTKAVRAQVLTFRGVNKTETGGESFSTTTTTGMTTFSDMKNGSTEHYPAAASRPARVYIGEGGEALYAGDKLCMVRPPYLVVGEEEINLALTPGEKQFLPFGAYLLIFPDAKWYNTVDGTSGDMDEGNAGTDSTEAKDTDYIVYNGGNPMPSEIRYTDRTGKTERTGTVTSLTVSEYYNVRVSSSLSNSFTRSDSMSTYREQVYAREYAHLAQYGGKIYYVYSADVLIEKNGLSTDGGGTQLYKYTFTNCEWRELDVSVNLSAMSKIGFTDADMGVLWCGNQKINAEKIGTKYVLQSDKIADIVYFHENFRVDADYSRGVKILGSAIKTKTMPTFDYVTVANNRLFGCRYGTQYNASGIVNRIYASKLGDFKEFETYAGISTDPFIAEIGEDGPFTGACTYNGRPMFFRENMAYILYGDYPPYTVSRVEMRGVAPGAEGTLRNLNGVLYWKSRHEILAYTGSSLSSVSAALGDLTAVRRAEAFAFAGKYYIVLDGLLHVYDTKTGLWVIEDRANFKDFAEVDGKLYVSILETVTVPVEAEAGEEGGEGEEIEAYNLYRYDSSAVEAMPWMLTSPQIGLAAPNRIFLSRLLFRIELADGAELPTVKLSFDNKPWEAATVKVDFKTQDGVRSGTISVPIRPRRCERFRWRLSGVGAYKLTGVTRVTEEGGR